jgi:hypothetical protein
MKITDLIVESQYTAYHQKLADQLPLGIRTIKQLCDESIKIAVKDLGVNQAGRIFTESFISEMLISYNNRCLQEGVGSFLGKAAGNVVGATKAAGRGLKNAWSDAKAGYAQGKASWDPKQAPATGSAPAPAATGGAQPAGADPAALRQQAADLNKQADQIEQSNKQPAATPAGAAPATDPVSGKTPEEAMKDPRYTSDPAFKAEVDKAASIGTPPATNAPAQWPAGLPKFNSVTGQKFTSPEEAEQVTNSPEFKQQMADVAAGKDPSGVQATQQQPAPTAAPTGTAPAPQTGGKLTKAQQDAMKAKLQGKREAGKSIATQTSGSFKDYVGGSQNTLVTNPDGSTSMKKLQRESIDFYSNFLGQKL